MLFTDKLKNGTAMTYKSSSLSRFWTKKIVYTYFFGNLPFPGQMAPDAAILLFNR